MHFVQHTATLPEGSGQWNSRNALPHCRGELGRGTLAMHCLVPRPWAMQLLQYTDSLPRGSEHCHSSNALPHFLGALGNATAAMHCHIAWGRWAMELLRCAGPSARETGGVSRRRAPPNKLYSCNALPHYLGAMGSATLAMHCPKAID